MSTWADSVSAEDKGLTVADLTAINKVAREAIDTALDRMEDKINEAVSQQLTLQNSPIDFTNVLFLNKTAKEILTSGTMPPPPERILSSYMSQVEHEITNTVEFLMYHQSTTSMAEGAGSLINIAYPRTFEELKERLSDGAVKQHLGYISEIIASSPKANALVLDIDIMKLFANELTQVFSEIRAGVEELQKQRSGSSPNSP